MKRYGLLTSGGDAPGMNAAIRAVVRSAIFKGHEVLGIREGYMGLVEGLVVPMDLASVGDIIQRGGTILGTSRSEVFPTREGQDLAMKTIEAFKLDGLVVLGGDGSMKGALGLAKKGVPVATIPCTIDNDLGYVDQTLGFYTAVHTIMDAISRIRDTTASHSRGSIIQVMGRHCGDLALYGGLVGGAESIVVPEVPLDTQAIIKKVAQGRDRGKRHHIIVVTEHTTSPYDLAEKIFEETGVDTTVTVLGYTQRGGSPVAQDRLMGSVLGALALDALEEARGPKALGYKEGSPLIMDLEEALEVEKKINKDLYRILNQLSI